MSKPQLSYNEFLAFLMIYAAEMNLELSAEDLAVIREKTGINNIEAIKAKVDELSDIEAIELIDQHREIYLGNKVDEDKVRQDLEALLHTAGTHSQLERAAVHILEKMI
jgi:hypothetical protein